MTAQRAALLLAGFLAIPVALHITVQAGRLAAASAPEVRQPQAAGEDVKVIAYYFHVTVRCDTCRRIERYSEEAIRQHFAKELEEGKVEWRPVNVQLAENRQFIKKYKLFLLPRRAARHIACRLCREALNQLRTAS